MFSREQWGLRAKRISHCSGAPQGGAGQKHEARVARRVGSPPPRPEDAGTLLLWLGNQGMSRNKLADDPFSFRKTLDILEGKLLSPYRVSSAQISKWLLIQNIEGKIDWLRNVQWRTVQKSYFRNTNAVFENLFRLDNRHKYICGLIQITLFL